MKKGLGIFCLLSIAAFIVGFYSGKRAYFKSSATKAASPVTPEDSLITYTLNCKAYTRARKGIFKSLPKEKNPIIFIGNSLTDGFPIYEYYKNLPVKNRGVNGNGMKDIYDRLDEVIEDAPSKIFLEGAINDIGRGRADSLIFLDFVSVIHKLQSKLPNTKLIILSVFPTCGPSASLNTAIDNYNKLISNFAQQNNLDYINIHDAMLKNGQMDDRLSYDGVHLTAAGYQIWREKIQIEM